VAPAEEEAFVIRSEANLHDVNVITKAATRRSP